MKNILINEKGNLLGIAMIYFLIFSAAGIAVLMLSIRTHADVQESIHETENMYAVESILNEALWRMNTGADSLANFEDSGVSSQLDDSTLVLTVTTSRWGKPYQVLVQLETESAFSNLLTISDKVDTANITLPPGYVYQQVSAIPEIDLSYYYNNADSIYTGDQSFEGLWNPGIHYVESGKVTLRNDFHLVGTLVVLEKLKVVGSNVLLQAGQDSTGAYLPALIVADTVEVPETDVTHITIEGAVYSMGEFEIKNGFFTGPFIGKELEVKNELIIDPTGAEQYYTLPPGFQEPDPQTANKHIKKGSWRITL